MNPAIDSEYRIAWVSAMSDIDRLAWNRLAMPMATPLLEWDWLDQMETSGSISPENGWQPSHLTVWAGDRLVGAAPLYIKSHSAGEFVFDHLWAEVAEKLAIPYYPKLVGMSPVTPAIGYRFLIDPAEDERKLTTWMVAEIDRFCLGAGLSGCSFLFVDPAWRTGMLKRGYASWKHQSYLWNNSQETSFETYLSRFNSNQRRNIRRERRSMEQQNLCIEAFHGEEIPIDFFPLMYTYYERTNDKYGPWGCKYLKPEFFSGLYNRFRHRLLFTAAFENDGGNLPVGLAMLLTKGDRLYGRYWGSSVDTRDLHFNLCFYRPIEWAIENNIRWFEPGMGSFHKVRRGFLSFAAHSLHRFYDPRLQHVMLTHIDRINRLEQGQIDELNRHLPFSREHDTRS